MKTVVISGYYGFENLGDEALLASIIYALREKVPGLNIVVLSAKPEKTCSLYDVEAVDRWNPLAVVKTLKSADLLISGGGSLLQDVTGPMTIPYYLGIIWLAKMLGKPVMVYAQGIGPINGSFGRLLVRWIINRTDFITLRDIASSRLLQEIGIYRPPVEVTADPVFGWYAGGQEPSSNAKPRVGIFVREWKGILAYKKAVAGLADYLFDNGREVAFIPMQFPADTAPIHEIAGMMKHRPVIIEQELDFRRLTGLVGEMELVIGMRLHALIIATLCGVPSVGLSYDPKVSEFLDSVEQPDFDDLENVTAAELIKKIDEVIINKELIRSKLNNLRTELRKKAIRNSEIAVELLGLKECSRNGHKDVLQ